ncbi:hypothetical protein HAX54_022988 [Datura stramonium]|uniref:Uncharacterized protein n=1 Tax=Datura stramonium TaxID=4076 RepID=A0ABS8UXU1_DATST|nr:hypothetical protein [Datura stramonium]
MHIKQSTKQRRKKELHVTPGHPPRNQIRPQAQSRLNHFRDSSSTSSPASISSCVVVAEVEAASASAAPSMLPRRSNTDNTMQFSAAHLCQASLATSDMPNTDVMP